jgi:ubiquinone/menaquinone biosynthesis C-methylase UbiE
MAEINLLRNYPKTSRNLDARQEEKTEEIRRIARQFGRDFFDGERKYGYGGYRYHPRFWQPVVNDFVRQYGLDRHSQILDVGCGKGFMIHDFAQLIPGISVYGLDISVYAITNAIEDMKPFVFVGDAKNLPFADKTFDLVISINTVHNLPLPECEQALREIQRVTKRGAFITVDAYRNDEERKRMDIWNLTAQTYMHVDDWIRLFEKIGYKGDFHWFIP